MVSEKKYGMKEPATVSFMAWVQAEGGSGVLEAHPRNRILGVVVGLRRIANAVGVDLAGLGFANLQAAQGAIGRGQHVCQADHRQAHLGAVDSGARADTTACDSPSVTGVQ